MKKINFIICLCISAILVSCGDDNSDERLLLTNANLQGTYQIGAFNQIINETATSSTGANVNLSTNCLKAQIVSGTCFLLVFLEL